MTQPQDQDTPIWPSAEYSRQVERLASAVGREIHLLEIDLGATHLGFHQSAQAYVLLGLIDFPRPDPTRGIAPHLILLDDGRGVNLGRVARISLGRAFNPAPHQVLYQDVDALQGQLYAPRRLSSEFIAERARQITGAMLGYRTQARLSQGDRPKGIAADKEPAAHPSADT